MAAVGILNRVEFVDERRRRGQRYPQRRLPLNQFAHGIDLTNLVRRQRSHRCAFVALADDDSHRFELYQRLPHEMPGDRKPRQKHVFGQSGARLQPAEDDIFLQRLHDREVVVVRLLSTEDTCVMECIHEYRPSCCPGAPESSARAGTGVVDRFDELQRIQIVGKARFKAPLSGKFLQEVRDRHVISPLIGFL